MRDYITVGYKNYKKSFKNSINCTILITMNILIKKLLSATLSTLLIFSSVISAYSYTEKDNTKLNNLLDSDILNSFKVTDSYNADSENFVIWIQDLHNDFATQKQIYDALEKLSKKQYFEIYGEGIVDNTLDVSILNSIPNERLRKETINNLFKTSILSACEYFVLSDNNNSIKGIENKKEYISNLLLLDKIDKNKNFNNYIIDNVLKQVNDLKQQSIVNRVLALQVLKLNDTDIPNTYPNLQKYQAVSKNLSNINYKKLNLQFKHFVADSKNNTALYSLLKQQSDYGYAQIYDYVNSKMPDLQKSNKELVEYLKANKMLSEINSVNLFYEKESFVNQLLSNENLNQNETEIINLENYVKYLKDLVNTQILPNNYLSLKENKKYFSELLKKYLPKDLLVFTLCLLNDDTFFSFFDNNIKRNDIFIENLAKTNSNKIIVAGGFHSDITKKLKDLNLTYIVLTPNVNIINAFNNLFSTTLKYGTDEQIANNLLSIISSWKMFFTDIESYQAEINNWIENSPTLKNNLSINLKQLENKNYVISVVYNKTNASKVFDMDDEIKQPTLTKKEQSLIVDDIIKVAKQHYLFGQNVEVKISENDNLLDNIPAMDVETTKDKSIIFVNKKFLNALYDNPYLIQTAVKLLFYSSSEVIDTDSFASFVSNNYEDLQQIYTLTSQLKQAKTYLPFTIKTKFKHAVNTIKASISNFKKLDMIAEPNSEDLRTEDEKNMAEALKQATIARQTRSFLTSFIQPPIGAYLVNAEGITGRNFNRTDSVLHAETLTFIDFLKNYIRKHKSLPTGELNQEGEFLTDLLNLAIINGENINNKIFQDRPLLLENLNIYIPYTENRTIDTVFEETNRILEYVDRELGKNNELGNPLATASLYCTLAPCNKCARTMSALKINKLVYGSYSVNKSHKSINTVINAGIKVVDGILLKECDQRIVNYRFMNLSMFRTKIASFIQTVRRTISNIFRQTNKSLSYLIANISFSETEILDLKYTILDLQQQIDWTDIQAKPEILNKLIETLKSIDAYDDPIKRASMMYVIKNKCDVKIENGNIVFYNKENKKLDFYINLAKRFVASKQYLSRMSQLASVRNFADMDNNLALRKSPFKKEMQSVFSILTLYGIGQPIPITGNTLEETKKRLDPLGHEIEYLIPEVYIENAALQCTFENGVFVNSNNYMDNIAHSTIAKKTLEYLENLFANMQQDWYDLFVNFIEQTKQLRKQPDIKFEDFVEVLLKQHPNYKEFESVAKIWGNLTRQQAENELLRIYQTAINQKISTERFKEVMKVMSVLELARLYLSQDIQDQTEATRLRQDIKSIEDGENLCTFVDSSVRYVVTAFRPTLVRQKVADFFGTVIQKQYPQLYAASTGLTTINVSKKGINKTIPLRMALQSGIPAENIIFTGDEFNIGGVDYPVYLLQQEDGNGNLVVINTNGTESNCVIDLSKIESLKNEDNITRSLILQRMILSIVEERIGLVATDPGYEFKNSIAQELQSKISEKNISDFGEETTQPEIINITDMLKAG